MGIEKLFTLWIMFNYGVATLVYTYKGDYARAWYWFAAIQIMSMAMFFIRK